MVEPAVFSIFQRRQSPAAAPSGTEHPPPALQPAALPAEAVEAPEPLATIAPPEPVAAEIIAPATAARPDPVPFRTMALSTETPFITEGSISARHVTHDQLGLANPEVFTVAATLGSAEPVILSADNAGLYRPQDFRPAPWSGFAYDQAGGDSGLAAGTRILTARGEVAVEALMPGDVAMALRAPALLPIMWVGRSAAAEAAVRIEPGAFGPNRPRRALQVAAGHPVFLNPVPVAARHLVNGTTITTVDTAGTELFHVDLGGAEVLFAEGVPLSSSQRPLATSLF